MNRLRSTVGWDLRVQWRQGFYYAALFVIVLWVSVLSALPPDAVLLLLPFIVFFDLSIFGFYFMAGMLFLEKGEGVLQAVVVTPLNSVEYLAAKALSLTLLAVLVSISVVILAHGPGIQWLYFVTGVALNSWLLVLVGFILAARYDAINEFLIPSIFYMIPSQLPALWYFGIWESWLLYLIPTMPSMLLLAASFQPVTGWQIAYAYVYLIGTCIVVTWYAQRAFVRFIVRSEGG